MDTTPAHAPGPLAITEGASTVPLLATPAAAAHLVARTQAQAVKAAHEAAHVCVAALLPPPHGPIATYEVSIRGQWSGATRLVDGEDTEPAFETASRKRGLIAVLLAGLDGERALFDEPSDGSASDIGEASEKAASIVEAGLHPEASLVAWAPFGYGVQPPRWLVEERYRLVERELRWGRETARTIVAANRERVLAFARILFERRRLETHGVDAALAAVGIAPVERRP